ncbi:lipid-A-disaccharide synthase [Striga asiatica]|uniref:Lipid-A-disaccharide synthase n=1 Tax=Striga asiatica TaxID=4170 RepID=A0A5A7PFM8_STRAF|nr:lipid-A-disaccharide synthase [Striga asiatica]
MSFFNNLKCLNQSFHLLKRRPRPGRDLRRPRSDTTNLLPNRPSAIDGQKLAQSQTPAADPESVTSEAGRAVKALFLLASKYSSSSVPNSSPLSPSDSELSSSGIICAFLMKIINKLVQFLSTKSTNGI